MIINNKIKYLNYVIFLLAISTVMTALPDLIFPIYIPYKEFIITPILEVTLIIFILIRYKNLKIEKKFLYSFLFFISLIYIAYLLEPIRYLYLEGRNPFYIMVTFFNLIIFSIFYLLNITLDKHFFYQSLKIYWKFNYIIAIVAILVFILLYSGIINEESWRLPSFFNKNFHIKLDVPGATEGRYSVPFGLTVIMPSYIKPFGFFSEFGTFMGLSYEPHIAEYFMAPAFFLTYYLYKFTFKNFLIYFLPFLLFFILSSSVTNIVSLTTVGIIIWLTTLGWRRVIKSFLVFSLIVILLSFSEYILNIINSIFNFIEYKINSRSGIESSGFIDYILQPKSIIGWGLFNIPTYYTNHYINDIGLINSFIIIFFYCQIIFISIKNILNRNYVFGAIGIYIFIHSLKFPLHVIQYPYLIFILFLIIYPLVNKKEIRYMKFKKINLIRKTK